MSEANESSKFEEVVRRIEPAGELLRAWRLQGGVSARMTALEIGLPDGETRKIIVRRPGARALQQNPHVAADEFRILRVTQSVGVSAPAPYYLDCSADIFPEPYLVIEYIEGQPEFAPKDIADYVCQMATQLAKIHAVDGTKLDLSFLPKQAERHADRFAERSRALDHSLAEGQIRKILEAAWPLPQFNQPVLLHGDFWPGNLLWKDGQLVAVIDWEDAELGDPLADLAISRLDVLWIFGSDAMIAFTQCYQTLTKLDFNTLPYWDLFAALRPASQIGEWASAWPALGRKDITEATMRQGHRFFINQASEKLKTP